jgi:hypothetical protein
MPVNSESINRKLFDLLSTRGFDPKPLDVEGKVTPVPEEAAVIKFDFIKDGENYGKVWISIDGAKTLQIYYGDSVSDSPSDATSDLEYDDTWTGFVKHLKNWAQRRQLGFELRNENRLVSDMARRKHTEKLGENMNNKLTSTQVNEGYYAMGKHASYSDAIPTTKIILQHTRKIEEGEQRYRNIAKIFVENMNGERFLIPTTKPGIARVYARHISEGGTPYDERGKHITGLVEEYQKMAGFVRATKNKQFNESAQELITEGVKHYQSLRETLHKMCGRRGYTAYFESWTPTLIEDGEEQTDLNELFVQETLDPRIESVIPILSKLHKKAPEVVETLELVKWTDSIMSEALDINEENIPIRDKEDYKARLKAIQDILIDPDTAKDPLLKKETMKRKAQLDKEAATKGLAEEIMTEAEIPQAVRSLYTQTYAKFAKTAGAAKGAKQMAYAQVAKKYGKQMADKLKAYHDQNSKLDEDGVAEGSEKHKQSRLWQMISDYEQRAKATKNDIKKQHYMKMADELRGKLKTSADQDVAEAAKWRSDDLEDKTWRNADWDDGDMSPGKIAIDRSGKDVDDSGDELRARPGSWRGAADMAKRMTKKGVPTKAELGFQSGLKHHIKHTKRMGGLTGPKGMLPEEQGVEEGSDISGLIAASHLNKSFIITAELAEGGTKKFRVKAQSERVAKEKFMKHHSMAKIVDVKEESVSEDLDEGAGYNYMSRVRKGHASQRRSGRTSEFTGKPGEFNKEGIRIGQDGHPVIKTKAYRDWLKTQNQDIEEGLEDNPIQKNIIDTVERLFHKNQIGDYSSLEAIRQGVKHHFSKPGASVESAIEGVLNILDKRMRKSGNYVDLGRFKEALRQGIAHQMKKQNIEEEGVSEEKGKAKLLGKDRMGTTCTKCKKGKYKETSIHDDWDGVLHCSNTKCNHEVKRWPGKDPDVTEDLDANQKRAGQLGPTEKVGKKGAVGKLVGN